MNNESLVCVNSIFEQPWWLDAVTKHNWECIELTNNNLIYARLPYIRKKILGFSVITVPELTQCLGVYIEDTGSKLCKKLEREKKVINEIIDKLPSYNVSLYLDINCQYVLPYVWKGFKIEPKFTYRFEELNDVDSIWSGFKENIKTDIKKANKQVVVRDDMDIDVLIDLVKKTYKRQNRKTPINLNIIKNLDTTLKNHNSRKLLVAVDVDNNIHAAAYYVYDKERCYYLMSGSDPLYRNSGAGSLLIWEGIKFAANVSKTFDFEGSNIEDIERFFKAFGATPHVMYHVTRFNWLLSLVNYLKPFVKKILRYK